MYTFPTYTHEEVLKQSFTAIYFALGSTNSFTKALQDNFSVSESLSSQILWLLWFFFFFFGLVIFFLKFSYSRCDLIISSRKIHLNKSFISDIGMYKDWFVNTFLNIDKIKVYIKSEFLICCMLARIFIVEMYYQSAPPFSFYRG